MPPIFVEAGKEVMTRARRVHRAASAAGRARGGDGQALEPQPQEERALGHVDAGVQPGQRLAGGGQGQLGLALVMGADGLAAEADDVAALHQVQRHVGPEVAGGQAEDGVGPGDGRGDGFGGDDDPVRAPGRPSFERLKQKTIPSSHTGRTSL
jgi:hypothetical protein